MAATFFRKLPRVQYQFNVSGTKEIHELCNTHIKFTLNYKTSKVMSNIYKFSWLDGLRPDIFAEKYYGSNELYWLGLFSGGVYDIHNELPVEDSTLLKKLWNKYKDDSRFLSWLLIPPVKQKNENNLYSWMNQATQEYRDLDGDVVDPSTTPNAIPISIFDYEIEKNEAKRNINVVDSSFASKFRIEYDSSMNKIQSDLED